MVKQNRYLLWRVLRMNVCKNKHLFTNHGLQTKMLIHFLFGFAKIFFWKRTDFDLMWLFCCYFLQNKKMNGNDFVFSNSYIKCPEPHLSVIILFTKVIYISRWYWVTPYFFSFLLRLLSMDNAHRRVFGRYIAQTPSIFIVVGRYMSKRCFLLLPRPSFNLVFFFFSKNAGVVVACTYQP